MDEKKAFGGRLKWLRKNRNLSTKSDAAMAMEIPYGGYQRWEYGGIPSRKNIKKIVEFYGCSEAWLLTGDGEPFPGGRQVFYGGGDALESSEGREPGPSPDYSPGLAIKVSEDLTLAARILESGTPYAVALHLNIQSFDRALQGENRLSVIEKRQNEMDIQLNALQKENEGLKKIIEKLRIQDTKDNPAPGTTGEPTEEKAM